MEHARDAIPHTNTHCHKLALIAAKVSSFAMILLVVLALVTPVFAQTSDSTRAVLRQAGLYQKEFRAGNMEVIPAYVTLLEEATETGTDDARLWYAAAVAYFAQAAQIGLASGNPADAAQPYQKGSAALQRALELNPDHPEALALRAGTRLMLANFARKPEVIAQLQQTALIEMNRALEINPESKRARLQRAFSGLTLPEALRNHATEAEDLDFLSSAAGRSRAGDYIRIMRADLSFELGDLDEARALYERVGRSTSPAADVATARLASLKLGGVSMEDIKSLRAAAGAQCVMCHGR